MNTVEIKTKGLRMCKEQVIRLKSSISNLSDSVVNNNDNNKKGVR
jgi:hypothetical protein